jgi:FtsZ-binding cell division protein ZapB
MTELAKKLSMKKTFFVTQLESFFSTMTTEFQDKINSLELENKLLKEQNDKLNYDVKNLVEIKNRLLNEIEEFKQEKKSLQDELQSLKVISNDERNLELIRENNKLKNKTNSLVEEIESLKQKISNLQTFLQKGAGAYSSSILEQKKEEVIKEITKNISK